MRILATLLAGLFAIAGLAAVLWVRAANEPQPGLHAADTTDADVSAIEELIRDLDEAWSTGDVERAMAAYTDGAVEMPPGEPAAVGKPAIRARMADFTVLNTDELASTVDGVDIDGDVGIARVSYTESSTPRAGGETTSVVGKTLFVFRRQTDGSWKIETLVWNLDAPASSSSGP